MCRLLRKAQSMQRHGRRLRDGSSGGECSWERGVEPTEGWQKTWVKKCSNGFRTALANGTFWINVERGKDGGDFTPWWSISILMGAVFRLTMPPCVRAAALSHKVHSWMWFIYRVVRFTPHTPSFATNTFLSSAILSGVTPPRPLNNTTASCFVISWY